MTWLYDSHIHLSDQEYKSDILHIINAIEILKLKACCVSMDYETSVKTINLSKNHSKIIENIDIGGPTLIRSAAKNYADVVILVDPEDYSWVVEKLPDKLSLEDRKHLASKAFNHVAFYDSVIAKYFSDTTSEFNDHLSLPYRKAKNLRYGENPHQQAA